MPVPDRDLTLAEVAELRRFSPRYLRELVRWHSIPVLRSGRLSRFDPVSLHALEEVLRCRSKSPAGPAPAPSPSVGLSPERAYASALRATTPRLRPKRQPPSKLPCSERHGTANVVALARSQRR